jgi:hypothetical protein
MKLAPLFPTLVEEAKSGYDVRLQFSGYPLYLQFKLAEIMKTNRCREARDRSMRPPIFRVHLRDPKKSGQHRLLVDLEASGNNVWYVAPKFETHQELSRHFFNRRVARNSKWIRPSTIGPFQDDEKHYVSYEADGNPILFSGPRFLGEPCEFDAFIDETIRVLDMHTAIPLEQSLTESRDSMLGIARRFAVPDLVLPYQELANQLAPLTLQEQVVYLAQLLFDCAVFIVTLADTAR